MLPPDFRWHAVGTVTIDRLNALLLDGVEVARLYQCVDDQTWWISLNNQRERERRNATICSGYEKGRAGGGDLGGAAQGPHPPGGAAI